MKLLASAILFASGSVLICSAQAASPGTYLFYNAESPSLAEIGLTSAETASAYDDLYGTAQDEIPDLVSMKYFYAAKLPDQSYRFFLNSSYGCGHLGCSTAEYRRDEDGYLSFNDYSFQIKCREYQDDKLLCEKAGYKKAVSAKPKVRQPVHYPAPPTIWPEK